MPEYNPQENVTLGVAQAQTNTKRNIKMLSLEETKAIAEEGFIYGLPIVMNYAVMYEYAIDKNSGNIKHPYSQNKISINT